MLRNAAFDERGEWVSERDVVQIKPGSDPVFGGCCLFITQVLSSESVRGFVKVPGDRDAYYQVTSENFRRLGSDRYAKT